MKKIETLELKEIEVIEVDGEFEQRFVNVKKYPVYLTNAALKHGRDLGLIENSLMGELAKLQNFENLKGIEGADKLSDLDKLSEIDDLPMINVIYLAFIGANKSVRMEFEEFLEMYHLDFTETLTLYVSLITASFSNDNNFAAGLRKSMAGSKKK